MGNNATSPQIDSFLADYKEIDKSSQGLILACNSTQITYLLKEYSYASQTNYDR